MTNTRQAFCRPTITLVGGAAAALVLLAACLSPRPAAELLGSLLLAPLLEETVFRAGLQHSLLRRWPADGRRWLNRANLLVAASFAAAHALRHPPLWAAATALPALALGVVYQRGSVAGPGHATARCALGHAAGNATWLLALPALPPGWR